MNFGNLRSKQEQTAHGHRSNLLRWLATFLTGLFLAGTVPGQELTTVWVAPASPIAPGSRASLWLHYLNASPQEAKRTFPARLGGQLVLDRQTLDVALELTTGSAPEAVIPPGGFARREYWLAVPALAAGRAVLEVPDTGGSKTMLTFTSAPVAAKAPPAPPAEAGSPTVTELEPAESDPIKFFKRHVYPYEPFYFIAGTKSPNAKFQISMKYRLFDTDVGLGHRFSPISDLYVAYTQTSLWDWKGPSAPFLDTSYKPELFYYHKGVIPSGTNGWFRLDLQTGAQHESNGRDGLASRSLNLVYAKPSLVFGPERSLQLTLAPRAWFYILDLSDNPDIVDYRGYMDLTATLGWSQSLQLATTLRAGAGGNHGSVQFDLTYPLNRLPWCGLTWYLHAQYFTGYGETFLNYKSSSEAFRVGFSLYR